MTAQRFEYSEVERAFRSDDRLHINPVQWAAWIVLAYIVIGLACWTSKCSAQDAPPKVCVNGYVGEDQARGILEAAVLLGWDYARAEKRETLAGCDVYMVRGDAETWLDGRTFTFVGMSRRKAFEALRGWEVAQTITVEVVTE